MFGMKKFLILLLSLLLSAISVYAYTIQAGVSIDKVPKSLFGSWQVDAQLIDSNSYGTFKPVSTDLWNLSRLGSVLKLENPFTGAKAEVSLKTTEANLVVFTKTEEYDNKVLKDIVALRLNKDTFSGINDVILETHSLDDGHILKTEKAKYKLVGKKLAGNSVLK